VTGRQSNTHGSVNSLQRPLRAPPPSARRPPPASPPRTPVKSVQGSPWRRRCGRGRCKAARWTPLGQTRAPPGSHASAHLARRGRAAAHERRADDDGREERQAGGRQAAGVGRALAHSVAVHYVADALLHELDARDLAGEAARHLDRLRGGCGGSGQGSHGALLPAHTHVRREHEHPPRGKTRPHARTHALARAPRAPRPLATALLHAHRTCFPVVFRALSTKVPKSKGGESGYSPGPPPANRRVGNTIKAETTHRKDRGRRPLGARGASARGGSGGRAVAHRRSQDVGARVTGRASLADREPRAGCRRHRRPGRWRQRAGWPERHRTVRHRPRPRAAFPARLVLAPPACARLFA
jgi:hypothetical protein